MTFPLQVSNEPEVVATTVCPTCKSKPGEKCKSRRGLLEGFPIPAHIERRKLYKWAQEYRAKQSMNTPKLGPGNHTTKPARKASREAKVKWLIKHRHLWHGWVDGISSHSDPRHRRIVEAMKTDGLVSEKTYWCDISLTGLINDARRVLRDELTKDSESPL